MDQKENLTDKDLSLAVVLPDGEERMTTVHGSKPVMDLLVTLCAKYHLNPASYTLELVTTNRKNTKLKPNALIGTLDVEKIMLKPKGEDKNKKTGPQMPEATVRMVINYKRTQKTILRVNPRVPLSEHLPAICEKCEFDVESTVLLRDVHSLAPLDLTYTLNDYAIRELYARDTKRQPASPVSPVSPILAGAVFPSKDKNQKEEENKGLFSKFRKSKKKSDQATTASAPASPVLVSKPRPLSMALPSSNSYPLGSHSILSDVPKKRRAPQPPGLVSQSCSLDISPRRRIHSEPNTQLDHEQMDGLSRGSSEESSFKRTKRKAPPPPTSPGVAVPETGPVKEALQVTGSPSVNALEEIMEQEETSASVMFATASDTQGEDSSCNKSTEVSLHPPFPTTDVTSTISVESIGKDQTDDLSSDGKQLQSTENETAAPGDVRTDGTDSPTDGSPHQLESANQPAISEESNVHDDCSTAINSLPPPVIQDAEPQYSIEANTDTHCEQADKLETPVATSTSHPSGGDAQVQTDVTPLSVPPQEHKEKAPSSGNVPAFEPAEKKDMATSTEEVDQSDLKDALPRTSDTSSRHDSTPSAPLTTKAPSLYAPNSEAKPKPSNEVTRDYIPKVGMTTYTIVPQKSLEKLRYFEVALTLERPPAAGDDGLNIGSLHLQESQAPREQTEVPKENSELHSALPREDLLTSVTTAITQDTVNGNIPESIHCSSATSISKTDEASQAGSPVEVKQVKIPPATKPKPGSFRLSQPKKTHGYYVSSAAEKSLSASSGAGHREAPERAQLPSPPPPPSPVLPIKCKEDGAGTTKVEPNVKHDDKTIQITRQSSLPSKNPSVGLSLDKLRSFAAPKPYCRATPSRFAQAVSSAVKRSQSLSHTPPCSAPLSPSTSPPSGMGTKGFVKFKDTESTEMDSDKMRHLVVEDEEPSLSETVLMEGESSP